MGVYILDFFLSLDFLQRFVGAVFRRDSVRPFFGEYFVNGTFIWPSVCLFVCLSACLFVCQFSSFSLSLFLSLSFFFSLSILFFSHSLSLSFLFALSYTEPKVNQKDLLICLCGGFDVLSTLFALDLFWGGFLLEVLD